MCNPTYDGTRLLAGVSWRVICTPRLVTRTPRFSHVQLNVTRENNPARVLEKRKWQNMSMMMTLSNNQIVASDF
jgi:hypothetical protein